MSDKKLAFQILSLYNSDLKEKLPNEEQVKKRLENARKEGNPEEIEFLETVLKHMEE